VGDGEVGPGGVYREGQGAAGLIFEGVEGGGAHGQRLGQGQPFEADDRDLEAIPRLQAGVQDRSG
jgi:hypothetical protein